MAYWPSEPRGESCCYSELGLFRPTGEVRKLIFEVRKLIFGLRKLIFGVRKSIFGLRKLIFEVRK